MDFNIDLVTAMGYFKDNKISKFALEAKLIDFAETMSPLDRVDVEICEGEEKGYLVLFVPKEYNDKTVSLYLDINRQAFSLMECEKLAELFEMMVNDLFNEGGRLYNWHKKNYESDLDFDEIVELYEKLLITSNKYIEEVDEELYESLIENNFIYPTDELSSKLENILDTDDSPMEKLHEIETTRLLPSYYTDLIKEDMITYNIYSPKDTPSEEDFEDGSVPKVDVATNAVIDVSDYDDENTSKELDYDYTPSTNQ
jgi:hypothetical protein